AHGSAQQEQAGSNPKHHPWAGPPPASPHLSLLLQGVRIPTLGSFDAVPKQIQVGDEAVTIPIPVFHLARNLAVVHNLTDNKAYLPGNKVLQPFKYAKVATAASVSRQKVEACIQGTMSLLSHCLGKGENVALVLKDIG
ncbi:CCD81 protein, partial [Sula dactylatra]|nr:CCD81 protein [Sula dactylatra]